MSSAVLAGAVSGSAGARVGCGADAGTAGRADADAGGRVEADAGGRAEADAGGRAVADAADLATGGASLANSAVPRSRAFLAGARPAGRFWPGGVTGIRPAGVFLADVRPAGMSWAGAGPGGALAGILPADAPDGAGPADGPGGAGGPLSRRGRGCAARGAELPRRLLFLFFFVGGIVFLPRLASHRCRSDRPKAQRVVACG